MKMDGNRDEAEKCIEIAERYIQEKNREKAEKFLHKAERLYSTQKAKDLLERVSLMAEKPVETQQPRKRKETSKAEEIKQPEYTQDQLDAVKKINSCKDYYQILGVNKDASDSEIKKAYKKLALQFHPDKNKCPGAAEAFKAIGNAVAILTDVEKRKHYDLYGNDDEKLTPRSHHYSNPYAREFEADATDELFNMFFGGSFNGGNVYVRRGGRWQRQNAASSETHHTHHREQHNNYTAFIQLLPILLAIVLSMASSFFVSDAPYSLQQSSKYPIGRTTQNLKIDYYVKENFHSEYQGSVRRLEMSVEEEYVSNLRHACYREKNYKNSVIWKAKYSFKDNDLLKAAERIETPSCDEYQRILKLMKLQ